MQIRVGYELIYDCPQPTPMILTLNVHYTRVSDIVVPDHLITSPPVPITAYRDGFGNWCSRHRGAAGRAPPVRRRRRPRQRACPTRSRLGAGSTPVEDLPDETLVFLLGSRYCETDRLSEIAWPLFGTTPPGWARVQAICDFVHDHITFGYEHARADQDGLRGLQRAARRLPRLSPTWRSPSAAA